MFCVAVPYLDGLSDSFLFYSEKLYILEQAGLSLKGQVVTLVFLGVRLYCSFVMEYDVHTFLDFVTFVSTLFVVYTMTRTKIRASYNEEVRWRGNDT